LLFKGFFVGCNYTFYLQLTDLLYQRSKRWSCEAVLRGSNPVVPTKKGDVCASKHPFFVIAK